MPLTAEDQAKYKALYFSTAKQYIQAFKESLSVLSQQVENKEQSEIAHRSVHSLTSQSRMMGFEHIAAVTSIMEHIFLGFEEKTVQINSELIQFMLSVTEKVSEATDQLEKENKIVDLTDQKVALIAKTGIKE